MGITVQVVTREWQKRGVEKRLEKVRQKGGGYENTRVAAETFVFYRGDFRIEVDFDGIATKLAYAASFNKSGKTAFLGGLVKGQRLTQHEVRRERREYPLPAYLELIDAEIPSAITDPNDDGGCDPLRGNRMDSADAEKDS